MIDYFASCSALRGIVLNSFKYLHKWGFVLRFHTGIQNSSGAASCDEIFGFLVISSLIGAIFWWIAYSLDDEGTLLGSPPRSIHKLLKGNVRGTYSRKINDYKDELWSEIVEKVVMDVHRDARER